MQRSECVVKWRGSQNTGKWNQQGRAWLNLQVAMCSGIQTDLGAGIRSSVHISLQGGIYCQSLTCLTLGPAASLSWSLKKSWDGAVSHLGFKSLHTFILSLHTFILSLLYYWVSPLFWFTWQKTWPLTASELLHAAEIQRETDCQSQVKMSRMTWLDSGAQYKTNS